MKAIFDLSKRYNFKIIEDASHAIGGKYMNEPIGNCRYSDITVFSFHPVKIITTGEGGMGLTNDHNLFEKMTRLRTHGITRDPEIMTGRFDGPWYYQQIELGYNYRMTDIQAALGLSQMERLDKYVERRHELAERYTGKLRELPVTVPWQHPDTYSSFHLYPIRLNSRETRRTRRDVFESLIAQGIGVNVHYIPIHSQPYYQAMGFKQGQFPESERYYGEAISLPLYPAMTGEDQDHVIESLEKALGV
jgi:dTDP-4-amino-4,6-dideoxygalactose transaminase